MIRHPAQEQLHRLTVKPLDQVFIMRAKEGLGCSQFEAEAGHPSDQGSRSRHREQNPASALALCD